MPGTFSEVSELIRCGVWKLLHCRQTEKCQWNKRKAFASSMNFKNISHNTYPFPRFSLFSQETRNCTITHGKLLVLYFHHILQKSHVLPFSDLQWTMSPYNNLLCWEILQLELLPSPPQIEGGTWSQSMSAPQVFTYPWQQPSYSNKAGEKGGKETGHSHSPAPWYSYPAHALSSCTQVIRGRLCLGAEHCRPGCYLSFRAALRRIQLAGCLLT